MRAETKRRNERPRELRRRVVLPARLRMGADWSDTCILNISSRGLLIQSGRPAPPGSAVELRRGDHVIVARAMWRDGAHIGLKSEGRIPVEEMLSLGHAKALQLVAPEGALVERRRKPREEHCRVRQQARAFEFVVAVFIAVLLTGLVWGMAHEAMAKPLASVQAALAS